MGRGIAVLFKNTFGCLQQLKGRVILICIGLQNNFFIYARAREKGW